MDSPHMYDIVTPERKSKLNFNTGHLELTDAVPDLADLNTPEISFDLQNFITETAQPVSLDDSVSSTYFSDILTSSSEKVVRNGGQNLKSSGLPYGYSMPQQPNGIGNDRYADEAGNLPAIKQEPVDHINLSSCSQLFPSASGIFANYRPQQSNPVNRHNNNTGQQHILNSFGSDYGRSTPGGIQPSSHVSLKSSSSSAFSIKSGKSKKNLDKHSDEYRRRRERNNIAVRKSREKAKQRSRDTERKVSDLARENDSLRKRVELLSKELSVLKSLLTNVGVPPESVDSEIAKSLHNMDYQGL